MAILFSAADMIDLVFKRLVVLVRAVESGANPWMVGSIQGSDAAGRRESAAAMRVISR